MKFITSIIIFMLPLMAFSQEEASFYVQFNDQSLSEVFIEVEEIYKPYKSKKKTKAMIAIEKGFQVIADMMG